jgi:hypothetical protein
VVERNILLEGKAFRHERAHRRPNKFTNAVPSGSTVWAETHKILSCVPRAIAAQGKTPKITNRVRGVVGYLRSLCIWGGPWLIQKIIESVVERNIQPQGKNMVIQG